MTKFRYPDEVVLPVGDERREFLKGKSEVIKTLDEEWYPTEPLPLRKDLLFMHRPPAEQKRLWELFLDLFALVPTPRKVFHYTNNGITIVPSRGKMQEVIDMLDFLLFERNKEDIIEYLRQQAKEQVNVPPATVPRGVGIHTPGKAALAYAATQAQTEREPNNFNFGNNNNYGFYENEPPENSRPEIRVNNNQNNNATEENNSERQNNESVPSRARGPLLNFAALLNAATKKKKKEGSRKTKQRRRRTYRK